MPRNIPNKAPKVDVLEEEVGPGDRKATAEEVVQAQTTGIPGGAPGIIESASTEIHSGASLPSPVSTPSGDEPAKVKRYRVKNEAPRGKPGYPVLHGGITVFFQKGKVVDGLMYDLDNLRRQNVELEEIAD